MKKDIDKLDEEEDFDIDIYSEDGVNELVDGDEISEQEAGFMVGYLEE